DDLVTGVQTCALPIYNRCVLYHDFWRSALRREEDGDYVPGHVMFPVLSWNFRMTEFCGAILLSQLDRLEEWAARRAENAAYLAEIGRASCRGRVESRL